MSQTENPDSRKIGLWSKLRRNKKLGYTITGCSLGVCATTGAASIAGATLFGGGLAASWIFASTGLVIGSAISGLHVIHWISAPVIVAYIWLNFRKHRSSMPVLLGLISIPLILLHDLPIYSPSTQNLAIQIAYPALYIGSALLGLAVFLDKRAPRKIILKAPFSR